MLYMLAIMFIYLIDMLRLAPWGWLTGFRFVLRRDALRLT